MPGHATRWALLLLGGALAGPALAGEAAFEWNGRRWYLENRWPQEGKVALRSFSAAFYADKPFDGRVFGADGLDAEETRFYRVGKQALPAGFGEADIEPDLEYYTLLPGRVVEGGSSRKPRLLDLGDAGITTTGVSGTLEVGDFVQMKGLQLDKKGFQALLAPVCDRGPRHRALRSRLRFVVGKPAMQGPDLEAIDAAVRPWLVPVAIGEVAQTCGPTSGTPVERWDGTTTAEQVEAALGPPAAEADTRDGRVLAYGALRLRFAADRLAGVELKAP